MKKRDIGLEILNGIEEIKEFKEGRKLLISREISGTSSQATVGKMKKEMVVKYKYQDDIIPKIIVDGEEYFQSSEALALLLLYDKLIVSDYWHEEDNFDVSKKNLFYIGVNCNDVFAWGCADAEEVMYHELKDVFSCWEKDKVWGTAIWCMIKRKQMPQKPVYEKIQKEGIWNLDELQKEHGLENNLW